MLLPSGTEEDRRKREGQNKKKEMAVPLHTLENRRSLFGALTHFSGVVLFILFFLRYFYCIWFYLLLISCLAPLEGNNLDIFFSLPLLPDLETKADPTDPKNLHPSFSFPPPSLLPPPELRLSPSLIPPPFQREKVFETPREGRIDAPNLVPVTPKVVKSKNDAYATKSTKVKQSENIWELALTAKLKV